MRYIKTKDGVYELISDLDNKGYNVKVKNYGTYHLVPKSTIVAQADTIEELCDEVVVKETWRDRPIVLQAGGCSDLFACARGLYLGKSTTESIYGSIWVDGNLIKVAQMNSKGEIELL